MLPFALVHATYNLFRVAGANTSSSFLLNAFNEVSFKMMQISSKSSRPFDAPQFILYNS